MDAIEDHCERASQVATSTGSCRGKQHEGPHRRNSNGSVVASTCASLESSRAGSPQPLELQHHSLLQNRVASAVTAYTDEEELRPPAASQRLPPSNDDQAADVAISVQPLHATAGDGIIAHHNRLATHAVVKPEVPSSMQTTAVGKPEVSDLWCPLLPPPSTAPYIASSVIAPQTPSPLPVLPMSHRSDAGAAEHSDLHVSLQDPSRLRVSIGAIIPAASLALPAGKGDADKAGDSDKDAGEGNVGLPALHWSRWGQHYL